MHGAGAHWEAEAFTRLYTPLSEWHSMTHWQ
jgi:hypothetical protein